MPDNNVRRPIVSIVSTGQMGAAVGARLKTNGVRVITPEGRSEASAARARAAGIEIVPWTEIGASDFIFSIVPPAVAVETAQEVGAVLHKGTNRPLYIDWNAVSPVRAQEVESIISAAGGRFVDGGIIGTPKSDGPGPLLFASGPDAPALAALLRGGVRFKILDAPNGAASALKMSYAGITKGTTALGAAMMLAAQRAGCADALLEELAESQAHVLASFRRTIPDMFGKAERFAPELSEIADFVGDGHAEQGIYQAMAAFYAVLGEDNKGPRREIETLDSMMRKKR